MQGDVGSLGRRINALWCLNFPILIRLHFRMTVTFEQIRAVSPWLAAVSGLTAYALNVLADANYTDLRLFAVLFFAGVVFWLLTLCALPFAIMTVWAGRSRVLQHLHVPFRAALTRATEFNWSVISGFALGVGKRFDLGMLRLLRWLKSIATATLGRFMDLSQHFDWRETRRTSLWVIANIAVTCLPLIWLATSFTIAFLVTNTGLSFGSTPYIVTVLGLPFSIIASVAIKTKFNMPRVFTFSPDLIQSFGKKIMLGGPILASLSIVFILVEIAPYDSEGWYVVLIVFSTVATIASFCATGAVIYCFGAIIRWLQLRRGAA